MDSKIYLENNGPKIDKVILENKVGGLALADNKTYYKDIIIKILQYEYRHRKIKHWKEGSPEQTEINMRRDYDRVGKPWARKRQTLKEWYWEN